MKNDPIKEQKSFYLVALGCPKNLVDSGVLSGGLLSAGWGITFDPQDADLYLINTCAFIPAARAEAKAEIDAALAWKAECSGREVAVCGCLTGYSDTVKEEFPGVDHWLGVDDIAHAAEIVSGTKGSSTGKCYLHDENTPVLQLTLPHISYIKIADGCNNRCSYCAIPRLRGDLRSRPESSVLAEVRMAVANGVREVVLVAQDITVFGADRPESGETLAKLLQKIDDIEGDFCVRLLYTHPAHYTDELIRVIAESKKVLHYLDMPLQHISDRLLKAMNRHIDRKGIEELLGKLRKAIPDLVLRTTFITGLPGETQEEFEELESFIKTWKFERMGVFPYAPEPGTPAAAMPDQIPAETAEERATKLMKSQIARMKRRSRTLEGTRCRVLIDQIEDGTAIARGAWDAPDIDNVILFNAGRSCVGEFADVVITGISGCDLTARKTRGKK